MNTLISRLLDLDPEARPTITEIRSAIKAISQGDPLPPYELSEVAQQRKEERRLSQLKRANQGQKKAAVLPTREHVPLAANSVAARRLAAKRSGATPGTGVDVIGSVPHPGYASTSTTSASSSSSADFLFDDQPIVSAPASSSKQTANELDFFGTSTTSTTSSAPAPKASTSNDFFDAFSTPSTTTSAPVASSSAQVDLFGSQDLFSSAPQSQSQSQNKPSATSASTPFDAFGGSNSLLTEFTTAPPPTIEEKAKNVLNLFDVQPQRSQAPVDPYSNLMGPSLGAGGNPGLYGQPRPMVPPGAGVGVGGYGFGGNPGIQPMYGSAPQGGLMMQPGIQPLVRQQQPLRQPERDPFGSLAGLDGLKKK
eukprot:CAMPEP_0174817966 /NCGR_PEP_ID=MMETSP1107-20130205/547_1 /TAXON_ID=36770 /ORGANISM="Paraphysomonas vestita, Strain GFlagA" /LENGTH=365 /DNA_ID=CAMNT_0016029191 /DNA_START=795 /DNA_END=1892 /DNA_ORIENTATION=+